MNQTKKRLKMINIAISITDIETIQLQIFKLSPLKTDLKIQEIISGLQAENYAQTQALISMYIETPTEKILQRTSQEARELKKEEEKDIIKEFDLFVTSSTEKETVGKEMFDFDTLKPENHLKREEEVIDFDALLSIEANDVLLANTEAHISSTAKNSFFNEKESRSDGIKESHIDISIIPKDTFFDIEGSHAAQKIEEESTKESHIDTEIMPKDTFFDIEETFLIQEIENEETIASEEDHETMAHEEVELSTEEKPSQYEAIPYIDQKFKNMHTQYPPIQKSDESFSSVHAWLIKISNEGYTNEEVEEVIKHITKLTEVDNFAEAAELLLITGATKSKFAQFILARALYKGEILQKNLPESFTLINRLAIDDDYPEAICDLAQFYEHGIGIDKDKKRAEILYKKAMNLDIKRAVGHYERLRKQNRGFFSLFKR